MKINDKVIVAFLVSVGVFSSVQATQYVNTLSNGKKKELISVVKASDGKMMLCSGVWEDIKEKGSKGS